ncbi:uncharacterized protein LOC133896743 isoform X1 [Phragmites australis]|uniref:uncharacterized protein LOC133896743 isoform X1 n=1 Tax=Phragmites australis TaxID=29695 RepID=UPI002D768C26|nr:uncharacterized protein LOC133896743 isoform X1 [Phragmites australis]
MLMGKYFYIAHLGGDSVNTEPFLYILQFSEQGGNLSITIPRRTGSGVLIRIFARGNDEYVRFVRAVQVKWADLRRMPPGRWRSNCLGFDAQRRIQNVLKSVLSFFCSAPGCIGLTAFLVPFKASGLHSAQNCFDMAAAQLPSLHAHHTASRRESAAGDGWMRMQRATEGCGREDERKLRWGRERRQAAPAPPASRRYRRPSMVSEIMDCERKDVRAAARK